MSYIVVRVYDMERKKKEGSWQHQSHNARMWKNQYPECVYAAWGY
jgi:hypothetical protein